MRCVICEETTEWEDISSICKRSGWDLVICRRCGFATYRDLQEEKLREAYQESSFSEQRKLAGTRDYQTKLEKLPLHRAFLGEILTENPLRSILDIGCSTGYLLKMCRDEYGCPDVCGTEWNPAHANFGRYVYQLDIRNDIAEFGEKKFDLICLMHVLEHILDPDHFLQKLVDSHLAPGGMIYLAMPVWFDLLGLPSITIPFELGIEGLLLKGHINICSRRNIINLFRKAGLKVVRENYTYYGYRVLLARTDEKMPLEYDDYQDLVNILARQREALACYKAGQFGQAEAIYPRFPYAAAKRIFSQCGENYELRLQEGKKAAALMPEVDQFAWILGNSSHRLGDTAQALSYYRQALALNPALIEPRWEMALIFIQRQEFSKAAALYEDILFARPDLQFQPLEAGKPTCLDMLSKCYTTMYEQEGGVPPRADVAEAADK